MSQLTNYIQKELDKGFSQDLITKKLLQAGYDKQEITASFKSLKSAEPLLVRKAIDSIHLDSKVKWSKFVFPLLAIVVVVVLGYLVYQYQGALLPSEEVSSCIGLEGNEKDLCYLQLSAAGDESCSEIENLAVKTACEQKIWEHDNCSYAFLLGNGYGECLFQKAIETKDTRYCTMEEDHSDCLYTLALAVGNSSLCEGDEYCLFKYAIQKKDTTACDSLQGMFQYQCYDAYAAETGDLGVCEKGSFFCKYPVNGTTEEKKTFIVQSISSLSSEVQEGTTFSERDKKLLFGAYHTRDSLFCSYVLDVGKKERCIGELQ